MAVLGGSNAGEVRVSLSQMQAVEHMYSTNPSLKAARTLLMGQLLSSGVVLRRGGEPVQLKQSFEDHLRSYWLPFARRVIDSFLCFGFAVVSIEEEPRKPFQTQEDDGGGGSSAAAVGPGRVVKADPANVSAEATPPAKGKNLIPVVPTLGTYEIVMVPTGRGGYTRETMVFTTAATHAYQQDVHMEVFYRDQPDAGGNLNSPIASCFNYLKFCEDLQGLAMTAEITRAQPTLVTQSVSTKSGVGVAQGIDQANLFFDSESRDLQQSTTDEQSADRQKQLQIAVALAGEVNRLRTTNLGGNPMAPPAPSTLAPDVPPRLFALPDKQALVPNALQPQSRTDLEALLRFGNEAICSALGVPASVIFEGKFSSNSMSQYATLRTRTLPILEVSLLLCVVYWQVTAIKHYRRKPGHQRKRCTQPNLQCPLQLGTRGRGAGAEHGAPVCNERGAGAVLFWNHRL